MRIEFKNLSVDFNNRFQLRNINWNIDCNQHWMIVGANGAGKSALAAAICGFGDIKQGSLEGCPEKTILVSTEAQAELIQAERMKDDADLLDVITEGTRSSEIVLQDCPNPELAQQLIDKFNFRPLMDRAFRKLSSGETRKLMLIRALAGEPDLLILDEPFMGLDGDTISILEQHLTSLADTLPTIFVLNRLDPRPNFISNIAYMENGELLLTISCEDVDASDDLYKLLCLKQQAIEIPAYESQSITADLDQRQPLVKITNAEIRYTDIEIFSGLNWTIRSKQHWQLSGPNGSGKTSLLSLITGDHPQCYSNDINVFGYQRGNGESIWQIKRYIGYMSSALQWEYRVDISARNVIISGFHDSIGLYQESSNEQQLIADQWLDLLNMRERSHHRFQYLSYGDQRLLLIARAMVKQPALLILDEPCLGLDEINRRLVLALIEKICAENITTVIYVSHDTQDSILGINNHLELD